MRIAIYNPWPQSAETELQNRIKIAANSVGLSIEIFSMNKEIEKWKPDLVLSLAIPHAKATRYMSALALWTPISRVEMKQRFQKSIASFDILMTPTQELAQYANSLMLSCRKPYFDFRIYPSCYRSTLKGCVSAESHLTYAGNNWDDRTNSSISSIGDFFHYAYAVHGTASDKIGFKVYGPEEGWREFPCFYHGSIPFDGKSFLQTYRDSGILLCLQSDKHYKEGIPSMRIFDACASGCLAICDKTKFIQEAYGDTVLYIDRDAKGFELYEQIADHIGWARTHPKIANEMVKEAQAIFNAQHALENTLQELIQHFDDVQKGLGYRSSLIKKENREKVDVIITVSQSSKYRIQGTLTSLFQQTDVDLRIMLLADPKYQHINEYAVKLCEKYRFDYVIIYNAGNHNEVNIYSKALQSISSSYFCILGDNEFAPNHFKILIELMQSDVDADIVYSGTIRVWENDNNEEKELHNYMQHEIRKKELCHPEDDQYLLLLEDINNNKDRIDSIAPGS